jgi:lantibiotic leader peptide-processing serine protease
MRPFLSMRLVVLCIAAAAALALAGPAAAERYVVLYAGHGLGSSSATSDVERAGGSVVATYPQIDVVIAESSDPDFVADMDRLRSVEGVAAVGSVVASASGFGFDGGSDRLDNEPVADTDPLSPLQWYAQRIKAPEAHAVTGGSPEVTVGVIDTGVDATHPDLDGNVDASRSVSCVSGAPNQDPAAWNDDSGHGTNVAGIIAAEANGQGIVGIAPRVKLAVIKASVRSGASDIFLADAVICSLVWAADHGVDVANNSYSVDSALTGGTTSFCRADDAQRTVIKAVSRAVDYAERRNVTMIASAGNNGLDMANPALDGCSRLPSGLPGVLTVSSIGLMDGIAAGPPSNYGLGYVDLTAPGGDFMQGVPPAGLILGPWPASMQVPRLVCDPCTGPGAAFYRYFAGTSQATAQVSGVAALVVSRFGKDKWWKAGGGTMNPDKVSLVLRQTADPLPCPADARCVSRTSENGFFGKGVVNALRAVTRDKRDP